MFPLFYFILSIFPFFFPSFFFPLFFSPPHTYPYFFFFFIPFFPLFPYHFFHTRALTFFSLFPSFVFFPTTSHSQNVPHSLCPSLIPQSLCIFFFFFWQFESYKEESRWWWWWWRWLKHKEIPHPLQQKWVMVTKTFCHNMSLFRHKYIRWRNGDETTFVT